MTSDPPRTSTPHSPPRLRLKPLAPPTGHVDGGWWPRTRDLAAELPGLVDAIGDRLGPVSTVVYAVAFWGSVPQEVDLGGRTASLKGFAALDTDVVQVSGVDGRRIDLLVISPDTQDEAAERAMSLAALPNDTHLPAGILAAAGVATTPAPATATGPRSTRGTHLGGHRSQ
ncbi:DUF5994 family protein [Saccharothrix longispora]|uniref:Uncharacterized protein n=1 Tax=Saccharothrix longispora TaxID=33920 RepID=A0ABU1PS90_9PSEU|nr:DUF5994 family protein [Saccharothrix longispora]MDR6592784.1 hypothetical protein [Saccharothrix longispora]